MTDHLTRNLPDNLIPDTTQFDFAMWCKTFDDLLQTQHNVGNVTDDQRRNIEALVADLIHDAREIARFSCDSKDSLAMTRSADLVHAMTEGPYLRTLGFVEQMSQIAAVLEHDAELFGMYVHDDEEPPADADGDALEGWYVLHDLDIETHPHLPQVDDVKSAILLARDITFATMGLCARHMLDKFPDDYDAEARHVRAKMMEERYHLPDRNKRWDMPHPKRTKSEREMWDEMCAAHPEEAHLSFEEVNEGLELIRAEKAKEHPDMEWLRRCLAKKYPEVKLF